MQDVELAAHKVDSLLQDSVGLVVAVHSQQCGHDVHEPRKRLKVLKYQLHHCMLMQTSCCFSVDHAVATLMDKLR